MANHFTDERILSAVRIGSTSASPAPLVAAPTGLRFSNPTRLPQASQKSAVSLRAPDRSPSVPAVPSVPQRLTGSFPDLIRDPTFRKAYLCKRSLGQVPGDSDETILPTALGLLLGWTLRSVPSQLVRVYVQWNLGDL